MVLVPYNISEIQKSIQFGHAVVEYGLYHFEEDEYQDWAKNWKTFIILNGGTSNQGEISLENEIVNTGTMEQHLKKLQENNIGVAIFHEPDLNNMLSAIVFIVDERVFNKKDYIDFKDFACKDFITDEEELKRLCPGLYNDWLDMIGGKKIEFLRTFTKQFRLA